MNVEAIEINVKVSYLSSIRSKYPAQKLLAQEKLNVKCKKRDVYTLGRESI